MNSMNESYERILSALGDVDERGCNYFRSNIMVPTRAQVVDITEKLLYLMFPEYFPLSREEDACLARVLEELHSSLKRQITSAYAFLGNECIVDTEAAALAILERIPSIKAMLIKDVQAIYEGDPAARSCEEVILCYPGFFAISVYRIAHEFYLMGIPCISRLMTEYAHEKTGVDIHAGAKIGECFCIDHGTGIVIGETATIGDRVKIYQGVTLGAKSFELDDEGNPVKGVKRHPDIGSDCVIYAGATILGGDTVIGDRCVIGGNVWLTSSVEPDTTVYYTAEKRTFKRKKD